MRLKRIIIEHIDKDEPVLAQKVDYEEDLENKPQNFRNVADVNLSGDVNQIHADLMRKIWVIKGVTSQGINVDVD